LSIYIVVDARSRRKRRQLSSSSYYISGVNPYSSAYNPANPLAYSSGSYYSAPSYGYPNTGYGADRPIESPYQHTEFTGLSQYLPTYTFSTPYASSQTDQYQNLGSTFGSGFYPPHMMSGLWGYQIPGFNNNYPNWSQGNSAQYYTGGTGSGLANSGYYWYRSLRNPPPFQGQAGNNFGANPVGPNPHIGPNQPMGPNSPVGPNQPMGPNAPVGPNLLGPMKKSAPVSSSGK